MIHDPLARVMLCDRFMYAWHDKKFPKFINPYSFKRLELEISKKIKYYSQ